MSIWGIPITHFAEIHSHDNSTALTIPPGATYTKVTSFDNNGLYYGAIPDATNNKITIIKNGKYKISGSFNFYDDTNNVVWHGSVFLNGIEQDQIHFVRKIQTAGDIGSASFTGIIEVTTQNIDLDFRVRHDNVGSIDLTIVYQNLNIEFLGY